MQRTSQKAAGVYGSVVCLSMVVIKPDGQLAHLRFPALGQSLWRKYVANIFGYVTNNRNKGQRRDFHLHESSG